MDHFALRDGEIWCEDVPLKAIAEAVGTPVYVYSTATMTRHARVIEAAAMCFLCAPVYLVGLSLLLLFGVSIAIVGFGFIPLKYVPFHQSPGSPSAARASRSSLMR